MALANSRSRLLDTRPSAHGFKSPRTLSCLVVLVAALGLLGCPATTLTGDSDTEADVVDERRADTRTPDVLDEEVTEDAAPDLVDEPDADIEEDAACPEANLLPESMQGDLELNVADPTDVISPGVGYDTRAGELLQLCVTGGIATSPAEDVVFEFREIENRADLSEALGVGVDVSLGFLGWGFSNHFRMARSRDISSYDLNIWVRVRVITGSEALVSDVQILPEFQELLESDPFEFLERCGDRFVQSVTFGGELIILLSVETYSDSDRFELENRLSASFGIFGSLGVDVESSFSEEFDGREVSVEVSRVGGGGSLPSLATAEDILEYARQFPEEVASHPPVPFRFVTRPYDRIHDGDLCLPGFDEKSIELIEEAWDLLNEAVGIRNALEEAIDNPDAYACGTNEDRRADLERVEEFLAALEDAAEDCAQAMASADSTETSSECRELERLMDEFDPPEPPLRWQSLVTFEAPATERNQSLFLAESQVCELVAVEGLWSRYAQNNHCPNPDTCWRECPVGSLVGEEFAISFDDDRMDDNRGVCTYTFGCFNAEDAYLLDECADEE